jgi:endonuclease YncB( thermonuclease family)
MNPKGLLTVIGSLDVSQFWPTTKGSSSSDGDTVHLKVDPKTSFLFKASPNAKPKITKKFIGAFVIDHGRKKKAITAKSEIKIRLQGIDTPELHYPALGGNIDSTKKGTYKNEFRQPYGAAAANALHKYLQSFLEADSGTVIHATFVTKINTANEAVDSHGRFVGDILVGTAAAQSINTWLVANGWAFPLFYDSMTDKEVKTLVDAWKIGKKIAARPEKSLRKPLQSFVPGRNVDNAKLPDRAKLNIPKIFRRQAQFWTEVAGPLTRTEFVALLNKGIKGKPDAAFPLDYFLKNFKHLDPKKRVSLADKISSQGNTLFSPEGLVFKEDPTTLLAANGKPVKGW